MLEPAGESGEQAIAALRGQDDETEITVGLLSALMGGEGSGDYEASVIEGTCETPGGVAHAIGAFSGGLASGSVNEQVDSLLSQELAIAVHEPGSPDSVVACGNMSDATELDGGEPFPTPASGGGV